MIERIIVKGFRILRDFEWCPNSGINIIVGDNAAGKSTVLDAIELAMHCRLGGKRAPEALDPHWFNLEDIDEFYQAISNGDTDTEPPSILIELYFREESGEIAQLQGVNNSFMTDSPGISLSISLDPNLRSEFFSVVTGDDRGVHLLPIEYYAITWKSFAGSSLVRTPDSVACFRIDANSSRSTHIVDYYARSTVDAHLCDEEKRQVSLRYRDMKQKIDEEILAEIGGDDELIDGISFQMDQSARSDWKNSITIHKEGLPLSLAGQGVQVEAKTRLALQKAEAKKVLLMEEPENHLSHTSLTRLMGLIEQNLFERQLFVTTHSAFVLNRLGLNKLALLSSGRSPRCLEELSSDTVDYFRKQSGVDTLRLALGRRIVLVEGPSDEMIFNWAYEKQNGCSPQDVGIDVIAYGVRGKRALELADALDKAPVIVLRDNDGKPAEKWKEDAAQYLRHGREMFIGINTDLKTLEPQMVAANRDSIDQLAKAIGFPGAKDEQDLIDFMGSHKTDWAWSLVSGDLAAEGKLVAPDYIVDAVRYITDYVDE